MGIKYSKEQFKKDLIAGPYLDGVYAKYFLMCHQTAFCFHCAKKEYKEIVEAIATQWLCTIKPKNTNGKNPYNFRARINKVPFGVCVNVYDQDLTCFNCSRKICSIYGEK